jgi:hypothetical protein
MFVLRPPRSWAARAALCAATGLVTLFGVASASATPINPPLGGTFTLDCNGTDVLITVPSFRGLTPRLSVDGTTRFIPVSFSTTITDLTTGEVLVSDTFRRAPGATPLATVSCVDDSTEVDPQTGDLIEFLFVSEDIQTPVGT